MGSFGTSSSDQSSNASSAINPAFMPYAKEALKRAGQVGDQGYVPYMGQDVAVPESLVNSWQGTADRNAAFNGGQAQDIRSQMPLSTQSGVQGMSSYGGYQDQLNQLKTNYPGLYDYISSFTIDPVTGKPGSRSFAANPIKNGNGGGGGDGGGGTGVVGPGAGKKPWGTFGSMSGFMPSTRNGGHDGVTPPWLYNAYGLTKNGGMV